MAFPFPVIASSKNARTYVLNATNKEGTTKLCISNNSVGTYRKN